MNDPMVELLARLVAARGEEASGWVVLVIDTDDDKPVSIYGPVATPEQALTLAGEFDRDEHSGTSPSDGSPGWRHVVLPLFDPPGAEL